MKFMLSTIPLNRYASLYFAAGVDWDENELYVLEVIHRYVQVLDEYFGNVCELDIIYNFEKVLSTTKKCTLLLL